MQDKLNYSVSNYMKRQAGFTLIEVIIVIVIVSIIVGAATLSFPPVGDKLLKKDADRFSALITLALDEAILQSTELSIEIMPQGYRFYQNLDGSWVALEDKPFVDHKFPNEISTEFFLDGILIELENREDRSPQIVILSSGEMTPFIYNLQFKDESSVKLEVSAAGEIEKVFSLKGAAQN